MKQFVFLIVLILIGKMAEAQDFSYLKDIDVNDKTYNEEAKEAALECCCYLTGVRYDKKDQSRVIATNYVRSWINAVYPELMELNELLGNNNDLLDMYVIFYAMHYVDDEGASVTSLQLNALNGILDYCSNSSNKLKLTKELKELKSLIEQGTLEETISNLQLASSAQ